MNPLVSVVVPTFNRKELLTETVHSILNQTYKKMEVIIVDNYSNYDIIALIAAFNDSRISLFQNENHGIIAVNRNYGIEKAKGEYIAFCDDDDLWVPEKLEKQIEIIANNDVCCTNREYIDVDTKIIPHRTLFIPKNLSLSNFLCSNFVTLSSVLVKKDVLKQYKGFTCQPEFKYCEDYELWGKMLATGQKFIICKEKLVLYRLHQSNLSENLEAGIKKTIKVNRHLFKKYEISKRVMLQTEIVYFLKLIYYKLKGLKSIFHQN